MNVEKDKIIQYMQNWEFKQGTRGQAQLAKFGKNYTITPTGEIEIILKSDAKNPVFVKYIGQNLTSLPFKFAEPKTIVTFDISVSSLTSLKGLPRHITGSLYCGHTRIILDGSVETVAQSCMFTGCNLESLEHLPKNTDRYFLNYNNLESLNGISSNKTPFEVEVQGNYISDLSNCPQNITYLNIALQKVPIKTLSGIPDTLEQILIDTNTPLLSIVNTKACQENRIQFIEIVTGAQNANVAEKLLDLINQSKTKPLPMMDLAIRLKSAGFSNLARL
jgi:hypothetical protein